MGTRWSPLAVVVAVASVLLGGLGVVAVVTHDDGDPPVTEALVGGEVTTTLTPAPDTTTSTTEAVAGTTTAPPTTAGPTTTTRAGGPATTRRTTTTRAPAAPTTSTPPLCAADQIDISGGPDRLNYAAGQAVGMSTTIRNRSSAPCFYRGYNAEMRFLDPGGQVIIAQVVHADDIDFQTFAPGQSITHTSTWDPRRCGAPQCPPPAPGIYAVEAIWSFSGGRYTASQQYVIA